MAEKKKGSELTERTLTEMTGNEFVIIGYLGKSYRLPINTLKSFIGAISSGGTVDLTNVASHIIPYADNVYNIGSESKLWATIFAKMLSVGGTTFSVDADGVLVIDAIVKAKDESGTTSSRVMTYEDMGAYALKTTLNDYITSSDLDTKLNAYVTSSALTTALKDYYTSRYVDYLVQSTKSSLQSQIEKKQPIGDYALKSYVDSEIEGLWSRNSFDDLFAGYVATDTLATETIFVDTIKGDTSVDGILSIFGQYGEVVINDGSIHATYSGTESWRIDDIGNGSFASLKVSDYNVIHAGNIGNQSVNHATSADSATTASSAYSAHSAEEATNDIDGNPIKTTYLKVKDYNADFEGVATESWVAQNYAPKGSLALYLPISSVYSVDVAPTLITPSGSANSKYYQIQKIQNGKLVVDVPWTDTVYTDDMARAAVGSMLSSYRKTSDTSFDNGLTAPSIYDVDYIEGDDISIVTSSLFVQGDGGADVSVNIIGDLSVSGTITNATWNGGKIANAYLANNSITIAGTSVSLGSSISTATLKSSLGITSINSIIDDLDSRIDINFKQEIQGLWSRNSFDDLFAGYVATDTLAAEKIFANKLYGDLEGTIGGYTIGGSSSGLTIQISGVTYNILTDRVSYLTTSNAENTYLKTAGGTISGDLEVGGVLTINSTTSNYAVTIDMSASSGMIQGFNNTGTRSWFLDYTGALTCRSVTQTSDATKKNIIGDVKLTVSQIAEAPAVEFTWKDDECGLKNVGTIAQYWKGVLPEVVRGEEGSMGIDNATLGVVNSIVVAREIEALKCENKELRREIEVLKSRINA